MKHVRFAVVGLGTIGQLHIRNLTSGSIERAQLVAVCDEFPAALARYPQFRGFVSPVELFRSGIADAVIIATPHFSHTPLGIAALEAGLHVLMEKPISAHKADAMRLIAGHRDARQVFGAMFNQRTHPAYAQIRKWIQNGDLGEVRRINWINTDWFRTEAYYASGSWRATWAGEGGGVLLNQSMHQLDLLWWLFGAPQRVRAFCKFGRYHGIEVEDDVTAYLEFANGATGVFISSTGELPGTNRLEIAGERGRVVFDGGTLRFSRNEVPMSEFSRTAKLESPLPVPIESTVSISSGGGQHAEVLRNFVAAVLDGAPLLAPAHEGIHAVELSNAMLMSTWTGSTIEMPMDAARYESFLCGKIGASPNTKRAAEAMQALATAESARR